MSQERLPWSRRQVLAAGALGLAPVACREPPPALGDVGVFTLEDQEGHEVTRATLRHKVWAAAFMFTRCPTVCPRITKRMRELQLQAVRDGVKLDLVSFSVDPEHDTPDILRAYAQKYGADLKTWRFLTGDLAVVKRTSEKAFKLALEGKPNPSAEHFGLMHGSHLVLVDQVGKIRGYYRTSEEEQMSRLLEDAKLLAA